MHNFLNIGFVYFFFNNLRYAGKRWEQSFDNRCSLVPLLYRKFALVLSSDFELRA